MQIFLTLKLFTLAVFFFTVLQRNFPVKAMKCLLQRADSCLAVFSPSLILSYSMFFQHRFLDILEPVHFINEWDSLIRPSISKKCHYYLKLGLLVAQRLKHLPPMQETWVRFLGQEDPLEKEMAIHSSILAWRVPWMEESGRLQSMGSQRVGHD